MNDDNPVAVPGISNFDPTAFNNVQIDVRLAN